MEGTASRQGWVFSLHLFAAGLLNKQEVISKFDSARFARKWQLCHCMHSLKESLVEGACNILVKGGHSGPFQETRCICFYAGRRQIVAVLAMINGCKLPSEVIQHLSGVGVW